MRQSDQAYDQIRRKIITLELPPQAPIDLQTLMDDLELGRTPIREALQRLAAENLVSIAPHRGIFVADISLTDLPKIFEMRLTLERFCARLAAQRITAEQIAQLEAILDELDRIPREDFASAMALDERFHQVLYEAACNEFLADELHHLHALSVRLWWLVLDHIEDVRGEVAVHREIIPSLKARDAQQAASLTQKHMVGFQEVIRAAAI